MASQPQHDIKVFIVMAFIVIVAILFVVPILILTYAAANVFMSSSIQSTPGDVIVFVGIGFTAISILIYVFFEIGKWIEDREQNNVMRMIIILIISILISSSGLSIATMALYLMTGAEFYLKYALGFIIASIDADVAYFSIIVFDIVLVRMLNITGIANQDIPYIPVSLILYGSVYGSLLFILKLFYQTWLSNIINIINVFICFIIILIYLIYIAVFRIIIFTPLKKAYIKDVLSLLLVIVSISVAIATYYLTSVMTWLIYLISIAIFLIAIFMPSETAYTRADSSSVSSQPLITYVAIVACCLTILITVLILGAALSIAGIPFYMEFLAILFLTWKYRPPRDNLLRLLKYLSLIFVIVIVILLTYKLYIIIRLPIPHIVNILVLFVIAIVLPHVMNILASFIIVYLHEYFGLTTTGRGQ